MLEYLTGHALHGRFVYFFLPEHSKFALADFWSLHSFEEKSYVSLKWNQIFSIHEPSSLWFLNRSTIHHLSYAFTLSITIDSL